MQAQVERPNKQNPKSTTTNVVAIVTIKARQLDLLTKYIHKYLYAYETHGVIICPCECLLPVNKSTRITKKFRRAASRWLNR